MRLRPRAIAALAFAAACSGNAAEQAATPQAADLPAMGPATITATDFRARVGFLADDALRGRDTPSPGLEVAAAYIASEFRRLGLEPAGDPGSYLQRWPYLTRTLETDGTSLRREGGPTLVYGTDFWVTPGSEASARGAVTLLAPAADTAGTGEALRGRIAAFVLDDPQMAVGRGGQAARAFAQRAGATAVLLILPPAVTEADVRARTATPWSGRTGQASGPPMFFVRHDAASRLLGGVPAVTGAPVDIPGVSVVATVPTSETDHRPPNVAAILRGSDPALRDTYIVFSAHMDHVGVGRPDASGDSIYNGADDDASGTSAILELAEAWASLPEAPRRSLLFLTVSGEEKGLLGSAYFAEHPTVPIESIVANINIDMIGRNAPDSAVVIGQEYSSLGPLALEVTAAHPELGLEIGPDPWPEQRFFFRSDHFNFARREVPALFFFTGTHGDYHRPSDEVEDLDTDKAARITRLIWHIGQAIAQDADPPRWTPEGLEEVRRLTRGGR